MHFSLPPVIHHSTGLLYNPQYYDNPHKQPAIWLSEVFWLLAQYHLYLYLCLYPYLYPYPFPFPFLYLFPYPFLYLFLMIHQYLW